MIHRAGFGSFERFIGMLTEQYAGKFPTWLSPCQVKVLPVSEKTRDYALEVGEALRAAGVRVKVDERDEKIGYKIREARGVDRVPYMLILGEKEAEAGNISVRDRTNETSSATSTSSSPTSPRRAFVGVGFSDEMLVWVARGENDVPDAARELLSSGRAAGETELALLDQRAREWRASSDAAQVVASYLLCHPRVDSVAYPGLRSDPSYEVASRTLENGFGPLVDVKLAGEDAWHRVTCTADDPLEQVMRLETLLREQAS